MRTNVLNDLSNVVKKGTGLACSWNQVGRMSEGAPDEHPMSIRSASDGERWKPAGEKGSTRVWKHVAMIFAVLVMSMANVGMALGASPLTIAAPSQNVTTQDGVTVAATASTGKIRNKSSQKVFVTNGTSSIWIYSQLTNITSISFDVCYNSGTTGSSNAFDIFVATGGAFAVPSSGFTATKNGTSLASLSNINVVGTNATTATAISVTFTSPVKAIILAKNSQEILVENLSISYDAGTLPTTYFAAHISGTNAATIDTNPGGASTSVATNGSAVTINSQSWLKLNSGGISIDLGSNKFQVGDQIVLDIAGANTNKAVGAKIQTGSGTDKVAFTQGKITNAFPVKLVYVVTSGDGIAGTSTAKMVSTSTDDRYYSWSILRAAGSCAATANAGADKSTTVGVGVAMAATAASSGYTGAWSIKAGSPSTATSQLGTTSSNTMTFTPNTYGTYTLVWTVTDNEDGSCSATDEATVTVPAPTHSITYTNLKGADNSANPTTYTEGVGVASFANLRHLVGYDFTGWSPSSINSSATTNQTIDAQWTARAAAAGTGTLIYNFGYSDNTITTSSITRNNGALYDATNLTWTGVTIDDSESAERSGKITTTKSYDSDKYLTLTFKIADGYTFTPTEVQLKAVAVSDNKTIRFEFTDNAGTPNTKYVEQVRASGSSVGTLTYDFDASDPVTLTGTVTVKIYAYGATNSWRLGTPLTITGTVASATPSCSDVTGLAYGTGTVNKVYGDAVFTNTLTNPNSLGVTYSSTNTSVATVNSSTGAVTIAGAGTTTIKATWAGNASYCEDEVTYTLNVKPNAGSVTGDWDRFGGETIDLSVSPTGGSSYTYQWQKWYNSQWNNVSNGTVDGSTTSGATTNNLQITNCSKENSGSYRCQVTSASQTNETGGYQVKVYVLECYNGGTTVYNFTRDGENQRGSVTIDLAASTGYIFKVHADNDYYGNDGTINSDATNWVLCNNSTSACTTNLTVNSGLGGTFTFTMDYSASGYSSQVGEPELSVTYPRKRIYLDPGVWDADGAKFAYNYWREGVSAQWTDFLTEDDCGMYADIPQWNGVKMIAVRLKSSTVTPGSWDDAWNQTSDLTVTSNDYIVVSNWDNITYNSTYSTPTYTIGYAKGSVPTGGGSISGSKSNETKTCGVDFTLPSSAVFTTTGYTQTAWTTSDGGAQEYALGGTYTTNEDKTFYPVWTVNNYDLTWNLGGGTTTSAGTGIASGVSSNTTTSQAFGTALSAPTVTKTGYNFSAWSPAVASTMPAANTTYAATWTVKTTTITIDANSGNHGSTTPGNVTATWGSALPSFTAATGASGWNLTGYFTAATSGTKVINADGTLVASTDYADASGNWKYETATLTLYPQYEEEAGEDCTNEYNSPSTTTYATKTFLDVSTTNYNTSVSTNYYLTYSAYWMHNTYKTWTWWNSNDAGSNKESSTYTYDNAASEGYLAIAGSASGNNGYGGKKIQSTRRDSIWFTGATSVACLNKGSGSATFTMEVFQVASNGTLSKVGSSYTNATTSVTSLVCSSLNASNYYLVKFYATAASNTYLYQVRFGNACADAPSCTTPTTAFANGAYTVGGSALDLSTLISSKQGSGAITYTVKNANGTGATIAGTSFTATSAGTATVTATQAADGDYCEKVMDATITVSAAPAGTTYYLVTSTAQLNTTDTYVIMADDKSAMMGVATGSNAYLNKITSGFTVAADKSTVTVTSSDVNTLTLKSESDAWNLFGKDSHYITTNSDVSSNLYGNATSGSGTDDFVFSFADGKVTIKRNTTTDYHIYYSSGTGFNQSASSTNIRLYTSNSTPVYTVTYDLNGGTGTVPTNRPEKSGTSITLASSEGLTKSGFTFDGWLCSVNSTKYAAGASYTMTAANTTFTAQWVAAESYSITYHCNGAESGCPSNVAAAYTLPSPLPSAPTKDGYDFGGWFTDSECTVAAVAGDALTGNTDLYAKWTERGSGCEDTPHAWDVIATGAKSYKVRISKVTEEVAIPVADATASNLTAYAGSVSTNDNVTVQIADGGSSQYGYKFDGSNTYLKLVFSTPLVLNDTLVVGMTNASHNISFTTTAVRSTTLSTSGGKLIIPAALAGQSTIYLWRGSGSTMYLRSFAVKHECEAIPSCTTPVIPALSNRTVCEGSDIAAWDATPTNASTISGKGESISYSWKKKGNDTELATTATFDLGSSAAESQAGTYVVTVTVSKAGYASASASKEVDLTVTDGIEVTGITADKATVYPTNSVTLTATASADATWQWYTCTNAEGAGESSIGGATSASYTIASAGAAGTYYYKAKATGSCGTAERVYTLTVSESSGGDCETEFWFAKAADKPEGATAATHISGTPSGSSSASYTATIDGNNYTITGQTGQKTGNVTITVPEDYEGTLYVVVQGSSSRTITLNKGGVQVGQETPANSTWGTFTFSNLDAGTYTLVSSGNIGWGILALKLCSAVACSDPEVTASADNTTACVGTSVTFTAANAHAEATYQWQKLNGTWTNISGETESTYTIASVVAGDAGKYRVIASHACNRTSNEVTLSVPTLPDFGSTVPASVSVMQTIALSINTVEATDAVKYRWYKSADATWDAGDVEIGTNKELIKAYDSEAIGSPSYYIFCRAQNACGITTSSAIAVNVTAYVEEDCATRGNEGDAAFGFEYSASQATYNSTACWSMNDNSKKLIYAAPEGKYFKTMKVTIASSSASKASYRWSTNGGTTFTEVAISSINTTLTEKTIDVSAHGNVNALQIGRNLDGKGESSGTLYVSKICFEYTDACTATTVTPSESSVNYEMGGAWSNPTFTLAPAAVSGETLTYSSSNEDIASVDDDGTVTFNGDAGTVTITASYAGGTISETEYCASSGSYTITVSCTGGAPKVVPDGTVNMSGCNSSITLNAKKQDGTAFADGTYQWFRNGEEIDGATSSSYTATQAGTYTVERTNGTGCTTPSTNSAVVTSETTEPEVERLVPFQYYHVDKTYSDQMKMRHLFAVKNSGKLDGKSFKMYVSRSGGAATDVTSSNALEVWPSDDGPVDTVMVDLNKLSGKYSEDDELVFTCKAIDCSGNVSDVYKETITMNVIGETPTLALICSGSSKAGGTRKTGELTVGGDFLTGYNVADLCEQTGSTSFDANTEWGLYTDLKTQYIVTPVNGYAVFNKLNYEPFDILLLTDYPKASKSDAAKDVLDDMAALCDYRPMLSFKTHMVAKSPSKWAEKGFTTSPVVNKEAGRLNLNIVCYAHPMFASLKTGDDVYTDVGNTSAPLVYTMLTGAGYESSKGMQGFELAAAENFITIGLTHYNATIAKNSPLAGEVEWTPGSEDRMLVTVAERQANPEARFILFSLNCGAQSKLTDKGEQVVLACLNYLLGTAEGTIEPADCSFTFDNGENNEHDDAWYEDPSHCDGCTGTKGDHKWTTAANWGPDYRLLPGEFTSVRIKKPVEVDDTHAHVMEVRLIDEGSIDIPAGKALDVKSTIRRLDGSEIYPTEIGDIHIGSASTGNGTLIFNNDDGDTKARVDMYSTAKADMENMSAATSTWQYIGTPHNDVAIATYNYYDSWLYQYSGSGWEVIPNGGPLVPFRGYCVTHPAAPVVFDMVGTLVATTAQSIAVPAGYTVIANSWTAPIDISTFTDDDMENISDKTIYFFNTGTDAEGTAGTGTEAGTYVAVPKNSASYVGTWQIPSMQGFYISTASAGTLHLDYDRHVRPHSARDVVSNPMYAPRRAAAESDEPNVLKIFARGSRYQDKLVVLEREDFTRGYDSGWDGEAWGGGTLSPMVYVTGEGREDAVSAIPEFEGTVVAFKAGEDSEYRFEFIYDGDESLYLFDTENNTYTQIMTGESYYFSTDDKAPHSRFILTRKAPQIATGVEPTSDGEGAKARKLLIEDKMYILLNGMLYDATGKVVK